MKNRAIRFLSVAALPVALFLVFMIAAKGFGFHSLPIILSQTMIPAAMAFGMCLVMNTGMMDFSIGARSVFAAMLGALGAVRFGIPGMLLGALLGGMAGAALMGLIYRVLKIPAMVVSLGVVMVYEIFSAKIVGSTGYITIGAALYSVGSYPRNLIFVLVGAVLLYIIYYKMKIGSNLIAVGNDELMCKNVGIDPANVKMMAFVLSGIFASIAGVLYLCYSGSITASTGMGTMSLVFKPLMCVLIARVLRRFVDNMPLLILIGSLSLAIIFNGFIALGFSKELQDVFMGLFMIGVMGYSGSSEYLNTWLYRRKLRKAHGVA